MKKTIYNCTEGGAKIKGAIQIPLCDYIEKYCKKSIDKSKLKPLLELADDADQLIEKVIPLLQDDIDNLDTIIRASRIGMAASKGTRNLMERKAYTNLMAKSMQKKFKKISKEAIAESQGNSAIVDAIFYKKLLEKIKKKQIAHLVKLTRLNYKFSVIAHQASIKNPLVNVAIYGASRQIQSRELKVKSSFVDSLKDKKIALIRIERNILILSTAKKAAESLKKSYQETLDLFKKYNETKDDSLLRLIIKEEINLDDAEKYFEAGNWAHPLLDASRALSKEMSKLLLHSQKEEDFCWKIFNKALKMKNEAIQKAKQNEKENLDHERKLLKYNDLIKEARDVGKKEGDFDRALGMLKEATELLPEEIEGRWGYATALHHSKNIEKALVEYKKLCQDFPENANFRFEYGQVLLINRQIQKGLREIGKAMEMSEEFDHFLIRVGEIYEESNMFEEALIAYENYLVKFPQDFEAWRKKGNTHANLGQGDQARNAYKTALKINPNSKLARDALNLITKDPTKNL